MLKNPTKRINVKSPFRGNLSDLSIGRLSNPCWGDLHIPSYAVQLHTEQKCSIKENVMDGKFTILSKIVSSVVPTLTTHDKMGARLSGRVSESLNKVQHKILEFGLSQRRRQ